MLGEAECGVIFSDEGDFDWLYVDALRHGDDVGLSGVLPPMRDINEPSDKDGLLPCDNWLLCKGPEEGDKLCLLGDIPYPIEPLRLATWLYTFDEVGEADRPNMGLEDEPDASW